MAYERPYLHLDDDALLAQCDVHLYRSSGPGGQHRNKVSSAVRYRHTPTGISAHADESRSQHDNRRQALIRLRMNLALQFRVAFDPGTDELPPVARECLITLRKGPLQGARRLDVGRKDHRFWPVAAFVLDLLEALDARLADAAEHLGVTTSNLVSFLKTDRHLFAATQQMRKTHGQKPLT